MKEKTTLKSKNKSHKLDEKKTLKQIEASFCDIGVFDIIDSYIMDKESKQVKQA